MICIYDSREINFERNGLGSLKEIYEPLVEEELNGLYDFSFKYPLRGHNVDLIKKFNIIKCDCGYNKEQLFRIKKVEPFLKHVFVYCQHISYDLKNNIVEDAFPRDLNGQGALNRILSKTQYPHNFTGFSDITKIGSARYVEKNPLSCIMGDLENSFLNVWGGEVERDNFLIKVLQKRGEDRGYKLSKTKNISGLDFTEDSSTIVTRAFPKGYDGVKLPELYVDSTLINDYYMPFIEEVDCSDMKLKETEEDEEGFSSLEELYEAMRNRCKSLFEVDHIDRPSLNVKIDLVELSKTTLYKDFQNMELLHLGDTVYFEHEKIVYQLRVIKTSYHPILKRINSLELGQFKSNYVQTNTNQANNILNALEKVDKKSFLEEAKDEISKQLAYVLGGNVYKTRNEIFIMDAEDLSSSKKVWRWNLNGLGYSSTGVNGKYEIAITGDGKIVADFITVGKLDTSVIEGYDQLLLNVSKVQTEIHNFTPVSSTEGTFLLLEENAGKDLIELSIDGKSYQQVTEANRNICPSQFSAWESGDYSMTDGSKEVSNSRLRLKDLLRVESNQSYYVNTFSNNEVKFIFRTFDENKHFLRSIGGINDTLKITILENEKFISVSMHNAKLGIKMTYDDFKKHFENKQILPFVCLDSESDKTFIEYVPNSPSPQFPSFVQNIGESSTISLSIHTKNLLNISRQYTVTGNNTITIDLTSGIYTISWKNITTDGINNSMLLYFYYDDDTTLAKYISNSYSSKSLTFTTSQRVKKIGIYSQSSWNESQGVTTTFEELILEKNDKKTDYVEYQEQVVEINLKENELCSLSNNAKDIFFIENERVYLEKHIKKLALTGNEAVEKYDVNTEYSRFNVCIDDMSTKNEKKFICSHFIVKDFDTLFSDVSESLLFYNDNYARFVIKKSYLTEDTITGFKNWLKQQYDEDKAVTLYYELENEEIITLEECNISTLKDECYIDLVDTIETTMSCKYYKNSSITEYFSTKTDTSAQIKIVSDSVMQEVSKTNQNLADVTTEANNIKLELDKVTQNYEKVGGNNKIHDSVGRFNSNEYWENSNTGEFKQGYDQSLIGRTESASKISIRNGTKSTTIKNIVNLIIDKRITLSYKLTNEENTTTIVRLIGNTVLYENIVTDVIDLKAFEFSFIPNTTSLILEITSSTTQFGWSHISDLMLGDSKAWEQAQGETWSRVIEMNEFGQLIKSQNVNTAYFTGMEGMGLYELNNDKLGERKSKFDISGLLTTKVECTEIKQRKLNHTSITLDNQDIYVSYIEEGADK